MKKTKILCLIGQLGNGGSERQLYLFLKNLDKSAYIPVVVVSGNSGGRWFEPIVSLGINVFELGSDSFFRKGLKFRNILLREKPDIVFSWSYFANIFRFFSRGIPFLASLRGDLYYALENLGWWKWKLCMSRQGIIVNSSLLRDQLLSEGLPAESVRVVKNIFDPSLIPKDYDDYKRIRTEHGIPSDAKLLIGIGRDSPGKNLDMLLRTLFELNKSDDKFYGLLLGSAGKKLEPLAKGMGLSGRLIITGEVQNTCEYLRASDIFLSYSRIEGMPNALIEALCCGCSALVLKSGGTDEMMQIFPSSKIIQLEQGASMKEILEAIHQVPCKGPGFATYVPVALSPDCLMPEYYEAIKYTINFGKHKKY